MVFYYEFVHVNPSIVFHNAFTTWKDKLFAPKWDSFCKHVSQNKANKNIGINVKKRDWFYSKNCWLDAMMKVLLLKLQMGW